MCHKNRGPRCSTCHKPAPRHRCRCPVKNAPKSTVTTEHDGLPTYAAVIDPQRPTSSLLPVSMQSRCGGRGYGGCGYKRRHCRGPIHLLVGLMIRKVQEKKERERSAANADSERESEEQEHGVIEAMDEKQMVEWEVTDIKEEKNKEDMKVLTNSIRSMSL